MHGDLLEGDDDDHDDCDLVDGDYHHRDVVEWMDIEDTNSPDDSDRI